MATAIQQREAEVITPTPLANFSLIDGRTHAVVGQIQSTTPDTAQQLREAVAPIGQQTRRTQPLK